MKKRINIITITVLSLLGITSCNDDYLNLKPQGLVSEATVFASYQLASDYARNLYGLFNRSMGEKEGSIGPGIYVYPYTSGCGRDSYSGILTGRYWYGYNQVYGDYAKATFALPNTAASYSVPYEYIRYSNIILDNLYRLEDATSEQKTYLESVARFFRAYCHFLLLLNYGDVIYAGHMIGDHSDELYAPRDSRLYVADQIFHELEWCEANIPDKVAPQNAVNSSVVKAAISRFCLFEGTWRKYHSVTEDNNFVTGNQLLQKCVAVSKELAEKYPTLYAGDGTDKHPGAGYGQVVTSEDLQKVPSVLLYVRNVNAYKYTTLGKGLMGSSNMIEMPQSTVDLYLTRDGLPIHNPGVKYYEYEGNGKYVTGSAYDYSNCDPYKTFRNRDPRLLQTVIPPYRVIAGAKANTFTLSDNPKYNEYIDQFAIRGNKNPDGSYSCPGFTAINELKCHKALPSSDETGQILDNIPNSDMGSSVSQPAMTTGEPAYISSTNAACQRSLGGYVIWKYVACWDAVGKSSAVADYPIFRMGEVLLNYAEAAFELGQFNQSMADATINKLRTRAGMALMSVASINDNFDPDRDPTVDPVLWEIRRERLVELMGESFSFDDVRRWKKGDWYINKQPFGVWVDAANLDAIDKKKMGGETGLLSNTTHKEASIAEVVAQGGGHLYYYLDPKQASGAGWNDRAYLMPIPTEEMGMNENLKQNPGWE